MIEILNVKRRKLVNDGVGNEDFLCNVEAVVGNDDLLSEILLRFPAELLFRCKCLSKHWCSLISSLISDPKFCANHYTRMNQRTSVLGVYYYFNRQETRKGVNSVSLRKADRSLPTLAFLNHVYNGNPVILHASNGLFLCSLGNGKPFAVCNLTTKTFNQLPLHICPSSCPNHDMNARYYSERRCAYLDFDPSKSLHYKIVLVGWLGGAGDFLFYGEDDKEENLSECKRPCYEIDIYSSESKMWKRKHFPALGNFNFEFGPLCNGVIHWMTRGDIHVRFELDSENLISNPISQGPEFVKESIIRYFGECCGRLFLIQIERRGDKVFNILEMDKGFGWTVAYTVNMIQLRTDFCECFEYPNPIYPIIMKKCKIWKFCVLCVVKEDDNFALLLAVPGKIISYNLKTGTFKVLCDFWAEDFCLPIGYNYAVAFPFIPTLSST